MIVKATAAGLLLSGLALATVSLEPAPQAPQPTATANAATPRPEARPKVRSPQDISKGHMRELALACRNVVTAKQQGRFPAPAILGADGQPKLSWRVAILPFLSERELFREFHLDEPWDSPHNLALIPRMPDVFRTPDSPAPDGMTRFRGFEGRGSLFEGPDGAAPDSVTDDPHLTVLFVQAADAAIWTKPGELPANTGRPLLNLDGEPLRLAMVDGTVLEERPMSQTLLRALVSRNGGEVVSAPPWTGGASVRTPAGPRPNPAGPPDRAIPAGRTIDVGEAAIPASTDRRLDDLDGRLGRLEAKLDRLLRKLEGQGGPAPR